MRYTRMSDELDSGMIMMFCFAAIIRGNCVAMYDDLSIWQFVQMGEKGQCNHK